MRGLKIHPCQQTGGWHANLQQIIEENLLVSQILPWTFLSKQKNIYFVLTNPLFFDWEIANQS